MAQTIVKTQGNETTRQRLNEQLRTYWESIRLGRQYPSESDIDIDRLESIWDSCFLVKYEPGDSPYQYIYLGDALIAAYGDDWNDRENCEKLLFPSQTPYIHHFDEVLKQRSPVEEDGEFTNRNGLNIRYRSILLPLSADAKEEIYILGGMRWKSYL